MSAVDWEHAPEIAKPTYEELEAMCWELTEQNAELRKLRELVREMYKVIKERNSWWDCMSRDTKRFADRMRELGIEVDA